MEEKYVKLAALLNNEDDARRLLTMTPEEASRVLKEEYNLDFSVDQLNDIMRGIHDSLVEMEGGELSENDLEQVAGGGKGSEDYEFGRSVGRATPIVIALGIAIACVW